MELILIRHGESVGNAKGLVYGDTDHPMTDKGLSQIPFILDVLKQYEIDQIYTSPLIRAKVIAESIQKERQVSLVEDERLKEINFGIYENQKRELVMGKLGDSYYQLISFFDSYDIQDGEHQKDFLDRVGGFTHELLSKKTGTYVITAHYGVIKAMLHHLMGFDKNMMRLLLIKPGAVVKLTVKKDRVRLDELIQTYYRL